MATVTINGFIHVRLEYNNEPHFCFMEQKDMSKYGGWVCVQPHTIVIEVPDDLDVLPQYVAVLERTRAAALDEAARANRELAQLAKIASNDGSAP